MSKQLYSEKILVRSTKTEKHRVEQHARKHGSSLSRYLINAGLLRPLTSDMHREEILLSILELHSVSKNLNNIAHSIYACAADGEEVLVADEAKKIVADICIVIEKLKEKIKW